MNPRQLSGISLQGLNDRWYCGSVGFFGLSDGDPLVTTLRDVFAANIVRVPEQRIKPLSVVAGYGKKSAFRGSLAELLVGRPHIGVSPAASSMASLSGKRSKKIRIDFGLQILSSVLEGFHIPATGIENAFEGATEVSFSFNNVVRQSIDKGELGSALQGHRLDLAHPSAAIFFGDDRWDLLIIDSTITSSDFSIAVDRSSSNEFKINLGLIQQIVDKANVGVSVSVVADRVLSFKGPEHLTFGFTCVRLFLKDDGKISLLAEVPQQHQLATTETAGGASRLIHVSPSRVLLNPQPAMITWDEWPNSNE